MLAFPHIFLCADKILVPFRSKRGQDGGGTLADRPCEVILGATIADQDAVGKERMLAHVDVGIDRLGAAQVKDKALVLHAKKGTDLYANTDGSEIADKTPRVLFHRREGS